MKQFLLPDYFHGESHLLLDGDDSHYLKNVLRYRDGDIFTAVDRLGVSWQAVFCCRDGKIAELDLSPAGGSRVSEKADVSEIQDIRRSGVVPEIILCQCLPKGKKMDLIIRQATEAGIAEIQMLESEFSIVKYDEKSWKSKHERFMKIAREAFQQSGSGILPVIKTPVPLISLNIEKNSEIGLFFHQKSIENISLHQYLFTVPEKIKLIIGPEGGLSDREISYLMKNSFKPAYLGPNVLRTETAALYAAAAVKTILLERETWKTV